MTHYYLKGYTHHLIKIKKMLRELSNGKGLLPLKEFLELWNRDWDSRSGKNDEFDYLFNKFDYNKKGDINPTKIKVVASDLG